MERLEQHARRLEDKLEKALTRQRLEWIRQVFNEAQNKYGFKSLGELIAFIVDHSGEIYKA